MAAGLTVDLGNTTYFPPSISQANNSGTALSSGNQIVGQWLDLSNTDTFCNVYASVGACSGPIGLAIQTAPGPNTLPPFTNAFSGSVFSGGGPLSGQFTDPTSGLAQLPTWVSSGGILWLNSGLYTTPGGLNASGVNLTNNYTTQTLPFGPNPIQQAQCGQAMLLSGSWPIMASGGHAYAAFQRPHQYVRLMYLSGNTLPQFFQAGFISNKLTTGSGGGATWQPLQAGTSVNV